MICPNCGTEADDNEIVCPFCEYNFYEEASENESATETEIDMTQVQSEVQSQGQPPKKSSGISWNIILIIVIAVFLIAGGVIACIFLTNNMDSGNNTNLKTAVVTTEVQTTEAEITDITTTITTETTTTTTTVTTTAVTTTETVTEPVIVDLTGSYGGGIQNLRERVYLYQHGDTVYIKIRGSGGAFSTFYATGSGVLNGNSIECSLLSVYVERAVDNSQTIYTANGYDNYTLTYIPESKSIKIQSPNSESIYVDSGEGLMDLVLIGEVIIDSGVLNVRDSDNATANIIGTLNKGDIVEIIEQTEQGWYAITYKGQCAFVSSEFIEAYYGAYYG